MSKIYLNAISLKAREVLGNSLVYKFKLVKYRDNGPKNTCERSLN